MELPGSTKKYPQEIWWFSLQRPSTTLIIIDTSNHIHGKLTPHDLANQNVPRAGAGSARTSGKQQNRRRCSNAVWSIGELPQSLCLRVPSHVLVEAPMFFFDVTETKWKLLSSALKGPAPIVGSELLFNGRSAGSIQDPGLSIHLKILSCRSPGCQHFTNRVEN